MQSPRFQRKNLDPMLFAFARSLALATESQAGEFTSRCAQLIYQSLGKIATLRAKDSSTSDVAEKLAAFLLTDKTIKSKFADNPYLAAYVYFNHLTTDADASLKAIAKQSFETAQKDATPAEITAFENYIAGRIQEPGVLDAALEHTKDVKGIPSVDAMRDATIPASARSAARIKDMVDQIHSLPSTLQKMKDAINREMSIEALDEKLYAFWGFHNEPGKDANFRMRKWSKASPSGIGPAQIDHMNVDDFAAISSIAAEVEAPIDGYSRVSGNAARYVMPKLARFLGKNAEERAKDVEKGVKVCDGGWCAEENRHEGALQKVVRLLTGKNLPTKPSDVMEIKDLSDEKVLKHLDGRQSTEWNASSVYFLLTGHSNGNLNEWISNILRDELKHLAVFSTARQYMKGDRPNERLMAMIQKGLNEAIYHRSSRSEGQAIGNNPANLMEIGYVHVLVEQKIREYIDPFRSKQCEIFLRGNPRFPRRLT